MRGNFIMNNNELIRELRALTSAGIKDCVEALKQSNWNLQAAVDIVKVKGLNIVTGCSNRTATEGVVAVVKSIDGKAAVMSEINCQTDFIAKSPDFLQFVDLTMARMLDCVVRNDIFKTSDMEDARKTVVSSTKENIVIRRFWAEISERPETVKVFSYVHSNSKIGVLLSLLAPNVEAANNSAFTALGNDLVMQIAAMSPIGVSPDRLPLEEVVRQKAIFETQLKEMNKPQASWDKIMEGKMKKWDSEICLLEQESVVVPKKTVKQVIKDVGDKLGGEIVVVNFIRCQVGQGLEQKQVDFAKEVEQLSGVPQPSVK